MTHKLYPHIMLSFINNRFAKKTPIVFIYDENYQQKHQLTQLFLLELLTLFKYTTLLNVLILSTNL